MEKCFCGECFDFVDYKIIDRVYNIKVKGVTYSFDSQAAICIHCGSEVDHATIMDNNIAKFNEAYRKKRD